MGNNEKIFNDIYQRGVWGKIDFSGEGSLVENAKEWIDTVNGFILDKKIKTILDLGCGDAVLTNEYNLLNCKYTGVDVSSRIIGKSNNSNNMKFVNADIEMYDYQFSDLIIIKDVLQHLNNASINNILNKIEKSCSYAIICNDYDNNDSNILNADIISGSHRPLNLLDNPFNREYKILKEYKVLGYTKRIYIFSLEDNTRGMVGSI